jgi:RimJ/RimL family protein N-acetyltransferase
VAEVTSSGTARAEPAGFGPAAAPVLPRRTARLVLRPFRHDDESDVLAYRSRDDVVRYMPADPLQPAGADAFIAERLPATQITADEDRIILAVECDGRVIGDVLVKAGRLADRQAEIGWAFNPEFHGRGLATEAARELLVMAFDDLDMHRAWAQLDPRNVPSARLCERLGLRREAYFRQDIGSKANGATRPSMRCSPPNGAPRRWPAEPKRTVLADGC